MVDMRTCSQDRIRKRLLGNKGRTAMLCFAGIFGNRQLGNLRSQLTPEVANDVFLSVKTRLHDHMDMALHCARQLTEETA